LAIADNAFLAVWFANFSLWDLVVYVGLERMSSVARAAWMYTRLAVYPLGFVCQTATIKRFGIQHCNRATPGTVSVGFSRVGNLENLHRMI